MGAKVGNISGGMVELFSWESPTITTPNYNVTLSTNDVQKLKAYSEEYSVFMFDTSTTYQDGTTKKSAGVTGIVSAEVMKKVLSVIQESIFGIHITANSGIDLDGNQNGITIRFQPYNTTTKAHTVIGKIYGIKL